MQIDPRTTDLDYEPETTDDAHEHGLVFHQVEDEIPLTAEDFEDLDDADYDEDDY